MTPPPPAPPSARNGESGQYQAILVVSSSIILQDLIQQRCCGAVCVFGKDTFAEARWQLAYERMLAICAKGRSLILVELPKMSTYDGSRLNHRCSSRTAQLISDVVGLSERGRPQSDIVLFGPYSNRGWRMPVIQNAGKATELHECVMPWCAYGCRTPGGEDCPTSNATRVWSSMQLTSKTCTCLTATTHRPDPVQIDE